jgi:hypothetical protein
MQLFLLGYIVIEICEIFTVGEFPLSGRVRVVGSLCPPLPVRWLLTPFVDRPSPVSISDSL